MTNSVDAVQAQAVAFRATFDQLKAEIGKVFVGQPALVDHLLICFFCRGHALIEGAPGLGKTLLIKTLSDAADLSFARVQCTPDLMPADVTGTNLLVETAGGHREFVFQRGPIFANVLLADEINRATPRTQAAFLEAMQESRVTVFGVTHALDVPFSVFATQNPIEMEGTYPLPEAQLDRFFFKLSVPAPGLDDMAEIMARTTGDRQPSVTRCVDIETVRSMLGPHQTGQDCRRYDASRAETRARDPSGRRRGAGRDQTIRALRRQPPRRPIDHPCRQGAGLD